jgi:hypothetical protein
MNDRMMALAPVAMGVNLAETGRDEKDNPSAAAAARRTT